MTDGCYKEFIIESIISFIRNKDKKPTTESILEKTKRQKTESEKM